MAAAMMQGAMGCGKGGGKFGGKSKRAGSEMMPDKKRSKGGDGVPGGPLQRAEVRYDDAATAQKAVAQLNGECINDTPVEVELDPMSKDGTRVKVGNIPSEAGWQEVKDLFNTVGRVAFADMKGTGKGGSSGNNSNSRLPVNGIVRYETHDLAAQAIESMNGTQMGTHTIEVKMHGGTTDKTKIQIFGMPPGTEWQELKDHFGQIGKVAFSETLSNGVENQGVVRYDDPIHAEQAAKVLNGSKLGGTPICVELDRMSRDLSRLIVHGIPAGIEWQELKDHFNPIGKVAFCEVKGAGKGKGSKGDMKGGGKMMGGCMNPMMEMMFSQWMSGGKGMNMMGMGKGFGKGKGFGGGGCCYQGGGCGGGFQPYGGMKGGPTSGSISYSNPMHAQFAIAMLNHSTLKNSPLNVDWDWQADDGNTLWVGNLASGTTWQDLKDHFSSIGMVTFANVKPAIGGKGNF